MRAFILATVVVVLGYNSHALQATNERANKEVVAKFYDMAFNQHKPAEAAKLYIGKTYIQHNPHVADGAQAFVDFFAKYFPEHPKASAEIKHSVAEGDLVVVHVLSKSSKDDRGRAVMDIFRLDGGKIVEHWDVAQPVADPATSANKNTMF